MKKRLFVAMMTVIMTMFMMACGSKESNTVNNSVGVVVDTVVESVAEEDIPEVTEAPVVTPEPTEIPTPVPTEIPTPEPTVEPTPESTEEPVVEEVVETTPVPTEEPFQLTILTEEELLAEEAAMFAKIKDKEDNWREYAVMYAAESETAGRDWKDPYYYGPDDHCGHNPAYDPYYGRSLEEVLAEFEEKGFENLSETENMIALLIVGIHNDFEYIEDYEVWSRTLNYTLPGESGAYIE